MAHILTALKYAQTGGLETSLPTAVINDVCAQQAHTFRDRLLTPAVTLQLFCLQILHCNTAITHSQQLAGFDFSPSSYAEARTRLPLAVLQTLLERMCNLMSQEAVAATPPALFGRRLILTDAVTFSMPDTPQLVKHFGLAPGQKLDIGYPVGKAMALLDYATGMFAQLLLVHQFTHDMRGVIGLHPSLNKGDILLGDTAFCSFAHICLLLRQGVDGVFFLHQRRQKEHDIQRWKKPTKPPVWIAQELYDTLPAFIDVRVIKH
jgi:hypothetical protein